MSWWLVPRVDSVLVWLQVRETSITSSSWRSWVLGCPQLLGEYEHFDSPGDSGTTFLPPHSPPSNKLTIKYVSWQANPRLNNTDSNTLLMFKAVFLWPYIQYYHLYSFYCCLYMRILHLFVVIRLGYPFQVRRPDNKIMGQGLTLWINWASLTPSWSIAMFLPSTYSLLQKRSLKLHSVC